MGEILRVLMITQKVDLDDDVLGFTHTWVNKLAERVAQLYVLALSVGRYELRENVTLYSMGKERGAGRLRRFVNFTCVVAPLLLRRRVDVVFVHMVPLYAILAAPWARLAGVPMVMWYAHGHVSYTLKIAHWLVERVVSSTPEGFRLPSEKLVIVGQGIDTEIFKPAEGSRPSRPFTVLSVGRISPVKDYETLIEAADILVNQRGRRDLRFVVVGDAGTPEQRTYQDGLLTQLQKRGLSKYIQFAGSVPYDQIQQYYQMADLCVNTSQTGSLDKAALEAMACGLLILTCNEAFTEILGDYADRLMFEKGNAGELAEKILDVYQTNAETRLVFGGVLRGIVVQRHSVERLMSQIVKVFKGLTKST